MRGSGDNLTPKQVVFLTGLLTSETIEAAAQAAGIATSTAYRWLKSPVFQSDYRDSRREVVRMAVVRLQRACETAVDTLEGVMTDVQASPSAKVAAAKAVLELSFRAIENEDLESRIASLEERMTGLQK